MIQKKESTSTSHTLSQRFIPFFAVLGLFFLVQGCNKGNKIPDVSHINADVDIVRFEKEMYSIDSTMISQQAAKLALEHADFVEIYTSTDVMRERNWMDSSKVAVLSHLMKGKPMKMLYDTCMVQFDDFSEYEKDLEKALQFYQYYFPEQALPKVYTCITEFGYQGFTYGPEMLVIGTEHFMGKDFPAYPAIFPNYQSQFFTKEHIVSSSMELLVGEIVGTSSENNLLDAMIREGKKLFILDKLLPHTPDSIKLKYTATQTKWCNENELGIYKFFIDEDLFFSPDKRKYMKYTLPTPTSPGMPSESPGRTANWLGWQIIKKYMKLHPEKSLQDLIAEKDSQKILKESKYKPR